jgi:hypothetical protein
MSKLEDQFDIRRIKLNKQLMDKYGYKQKSKDKTDETEDESDKEKKK